ncbi:MAG: iron-sulfur cluster assembly accessory protein [Gammaproteobacteria bacterium]|nr:iron-sulfur cluster assembly accessory protein [Gammaproteobacteria bacterium]
MITLTSKTAKQIQHSAVQGKMEGIPLRIAVTRKPDSSLHYAMGFDDVPSDSDHRMNSEGIAIVVSEQSAELIKGTVVDYVELEPGKFHFIFLNPNDPNYQLPDQEQSSGDNPGVVR